MRKIYSRVLLFCCSVFLVSCASEQKVTYDKAEAGGIRKFESNVEFATGKDGEATWKNAKRSSFENQAGFNASKDFKGKSYNVNNYGKKGWAQNKDYAAQSYGGNKDGSKYQRSPYFARKQSGEQGQLANAGLKDYTAGNYQGARDQVNRGRQISRPEDAKTNVRRRVYKEPAIQTSEEYNGLNLSDTNSLLGR